MITLEQAFGQARQKLEAGQLGPQDLDELYRLARGGRQRLLYLYALQPTVRAGLVASTLQDATHASQIDPMAEELPYRSVMDAVADGWRVIHFPDHRAPFQEGRVDILGYEFVLEKYGA